MTERASPADPERDRMARQVALFSVLLHARHRSEFSEAADAQAELERAGIVVKFRRQAGQRSGKEVRRAN
jgi:hypothetical protein